MKIFLNLFFFFLNRDLNLRKPIYQQTSCYGHFGRDCFPWEEAKSLEVDWLDDGNDASNGDSIAAKKAKYS